MEHKRKTEAREPNKPPTEDDIFLTELHDACARAAAAYLKTRIATTPGREIRTLTLPEMVNMSHAIEAKWIQMVSQRKSAAPVAREYENLLIG